LPLPVRHAVTRKAVPPPLKCERLCRQNMLTTDELIDSALARSQRLLWELSKLGIDDDLDDQSVNTPTSTGTSSNTWGSFSSESEDESSHLESEHTSMASLQTNEAELCLRLRGLEEELRGVMSLHECSVSCSCYSPEPQVATCLAGKSLPQGEPPKSKHPIASHNLRAPWACSARSAPVRGHDTRSRNDIVCKFVGVTEVLACESFVT